MSENVIRVEPETWLMMRMLRSNISAMKSRNVEDKWSKAIDKEKSLLKSYFNEVLGRKS